TPETFGCARATLLCGAARQDRCRSGSSHFRPPLPAFRVSPNPIRNSGAKPPSVGPRSIRFREDLRRYFSSARSVRRGLLPNAPGPPGSAQCTIAPSEKSVRKEVRDEKRRWPRRSAAPSSDTREYLLQRLRKAAPTAEPAPLQEWLRPRSPQKQEV